MKRIRGHARLLCRHWARATAWVAGLLRGSTFLQGLRLVLLVPLLGLVELKLGDEGALAGVSGGFALTGSMQGRRQAPPLPWSATR